MLSEKAAKVLMLLIRNEGRPMTAGRMAAALSMSERSISSYLKEVYAFCDEKGITVANKAGVGTFLNCRGREQEVLDELSGAGAVGDCASKRLFYIVKVLLNNRTSYTTTLFAEDLKVSKDTVGQDLKLAKLYLEQAGIELVKRPGAGIYVRGPELKIRRAIVEVNRMEPEEGADGENGGDYRLKPGTFKRLSGCFRGYRIEAFVQVIQNMEKRWGRCLSDRSFEALIEYLAVTAARVKHGYRMEPDFTYQVESMDSREMPPAKESALSREATLPGVEGAARSLMTALGLPREEEAYISLLLCCMEYQEAPDGQGEPVTSKERDFALRVIQYVYMVMGLEGGADELLVRTLACYNRSALPRIRYGVEIKNPFLEEVKRTYPAVFSACFAAGSVIYKEAAGELPSENEISCLSLLMGGAIVRGERTIRTVVICAGGVGTSQILARKLKDQVPQLLIAEVLGYERRDMLRQLNPQLVVSTIRDVKADCPVAVISPVLSRDDLKLLNRLCSGIYTKAQPAGGSLLDLLDDELIFLDCEETSRERLLEQMSGKLEEKGYVTEQFLRDVRDREERGSTALGFKVAIPHGISGFVKKPAVCVAQLRETMDWTGEPVSLVFMLALDFEDVESTRAFFNGFYHLTCEVKIADILREAGTPAQFRQMIGDYCI